MSLPGALKISVCSVWWDDKSCQLPPDADASKLKRNIRYALCRSSFDLEGPIEIRTFSDVMKVESTHTPPQGKEAVVNKITSEMLFWMDDNPASSAIFLISGDGIFSDTLGCLKMRKYPTMVARPRGGAMSPYLFSSAKHVWDWPSLAMGTYLDPLSDTQILDEVKKGIVFEPMSEPEQKQKKRKKRNRMQEHEAELVVQEHEAVSEVQEPRKKKRKKSKSRSDGQQAEN